MYEFNEFNWSIIDNKSAIYVDWQAIKGNKLI